MKTATCEKCNDKLNKDELEDAESLKDHKFYEDKCVGCIFVSLRENLEKEQAH